MNRKSEKISQPNCHNNENVNYFLHAWSAFIVDFELVLRSFSVRLNSRLDVVCSSVVGERNRSRAVATLNMCHQKSFSMKIKSIRSGNYFISSAENFLSLTSDSPRFPSSTRQHLFTRNFLKLIQLNCFQLIFMQIVSILLVMIELTFDLETKRSRWVAIDRRKQ